MKVKSSAQSEITLFKLAKSRKENSGSITILKPIKYPVKVTVALLWCYIVCLPMAY